MKVKKDWNEMKQNPCKGEMNEWKTFGIETKQKKNLAMFCK